MVHILIEYLNSLSENLDTALEILTKKNPNILFKEFENLVIFKYKNKYGSEIERSCRGLIFDKNTKKIVCQSSVGTLDFESFIEKVPPNDCVIEENLEGTLINLYYYKNRWNVSTKFCINAENSKFRGNKSFRQYFDKLFDKNIYKSLDINFTYSFLLQIPDNKLVSDINKRKLYHIESQNNITGEKVNCDINIPKPKILKLKKFNELNITGYRDLNRELMKLKWLTRGFMLYSLNRNYRCSLMNPGYLTVYALIKNQTDLKYVFLESLYYKHNSDDILYYFPDYNNIKNQVISDLDSLIKILLDDYIHVYCFKDKEIDSIQGTYKRTLGNIQKLYKKNHRNNLLFRIDYDNVKEVLLNESCAYVYTVLYK